MARRKFFEEEIVFNPKFLDENLFSTLKTMISEKYPKTFKNEGFIEKIEVHHVDNRITMSGQIIMKINFSALILKPVIGSIFFGQVVKNSKHCWVEVEMETNKFPIFLRESQISPNTRVNVKITHVKSDNTVCFGEITQ